MTDRIVADSDELMLHSSRLDAVAASMQERVIGERGMAEDLASAGSYPLAEVGERFAEAWTMGGFVLAGGITSVAEVLADAAVAYAALDLAIAEQFDD